eukprot:NODE_8_length_66115_cov_0.981823.p8 type:complete len:598 gc:universal NODE_8_length_66115_cov_0.981823:2950-1157(-)
MGNIFSSVFCLFKKIRHSEPEKHLNVNPIHYYLQEYPDENLNQNDLIKLSSYFPGIFTALCPSYCPIEDVYKISKTKDVVLATVADGHHGAECAHFTISVLHDVLGYLLDHMPPTKALEISHLILDEFILNLPFYLDITDFKNHYNLEMQIGSIDTPLRMGTTRTSKDQFCPVLKMDLNAVGISLSGATSLTAMITEEEGVRKLYAANLGDSSAILVRLHHNGEYSAYKLTTSHTAKSTKEYERLIREHPNEEKTLAGVNMYGEMRLLGVLIPTRSFGDCTLKWDIKQSKKINKLLDKNAYVYTSNVKRSTITDGLEENMLTPPYVTAKPEIYIRNIENSDRIKDKYAILGTDGIWDKISPEMASYLVINAVRVQEATKKKMAVERNMIKVQSLKNIPDFCNPEKTDKIHPCLLDSNPAVAVLRYVLGADDEHVTEQLNMEYPKTKSKRDDCTVVVIDLLTQEYFQSGSQANLMHSSENRPEYVGHELHSHKKIIDIAHPITTLSHFEKVHSEVSVASDDKVEVELLSNSDNFSPIQDIINSSLAGKSIGQLNKSSSQLNSPKTPPSIISRNSDIQPQDIPFVNSSRGEYLVRALFA